MKVSAYKWLLIILFVPCFLVSVSECFENAADEKTFVDGLLAKLTKYGPHTNMVNKTAFVLFDLYKVTDINEKEGKVTMRIWVYINYYIPGLEWDPDVVGVYGVILPAGTVWAPDIVPYDANEVIYQDFNQQFILSDGMVVPFSSSLTVEINCIIRIRYFPFDTQDCPVKIGQWSFTQSMYRIGVDPTFSKSDQLGLNSFEQSGQWKLLEPVLFKITDRVTSENTPEFFRYDQIEYYFKFQRHPLFYVIVIIVPSIILGVLSVLIFILPVESGEKVSLGITILLSQTVELLVLSDVLPPASGDDFPIVGYLVTFLIVLISIAVLVSIFVTSIYHTPPCRCLPAWIGKIMNSRLMDFLHAEKLGMNEQITKWEDLKEKCAQNTRMLENGAQSSSQLFQDNNFPSQQPQKSVRDNFGATEEPVPDELKAAELAKDKTELAELQIELNTRAWRLFSVLIDRIAFYIYIVVFAIGSLYFLLEAMYGD